MMNETLLKEIIISQRKIFLNREGLFRREILEDFHKKYYKLKEILVITGVRRSGKSSLMKLIWNDIKTKEKMQDDQFLYLNFEDERLLDFDKNDFTKLLESYYQINSPDKKKKICLFLDEVQNVRYWEKWVYRLYEENKFKIFITGSNATLLSSELATALTGRNIAITLYPLSFYEFYVYFKNNSLTKQSFYDLEEKAKIKKAMNEYVKFGGMPEYIKTKSTELIQEYFKNILSRDIVNRYNIKYKQGLKELAHILLANLGSVYSLRNLSKSIEIKNINTIKNYLQYLENSFLFFLVPLFSFSYKKQIYNPNKIYSIDTAFFNNIAFKTSANIGALYENIVFLQLMRNKDNEIFYYKTKNNFEIDFVIKRKNKVKDLIQVSQNLSNARTVEREERALIEAMKEFGLKQGIIINESIEKIKMIPKSKPARIATRSVAGGNTKIIYIPLWKWLLVKN